MNEFIGATAAAVVVFASTNVDDILLLAAFFSDPAFTRGQVVVGQVLGMSALVVASAGCAAAAVVVPEGWTGLLGLAPLLLGVRSLGRLFRSRPAPDAKDAGDDVAMRARSAVLAMAGVTIANGGDNLGVYIPMFSNTPRFVPLYVIVFGIMTVLWCAAGYYVVNNRLVGDHIRRFGRVALPFVLVGLGVWLLSDVYRVVMG